MDFQSLSIVRETLARPAIARSAIWAVLGAGFLTFAASLDRYPQSFIDDSFYNYPAISFIEGKGFRYEVSSKAPSAASTLGIPCAVLSPDAGCNVYRPRGE